MDTILAVDMPTKEWTPEQIQELAALAKRKGVKKGELATEFIGCTGPALSYWMNPESGRVPSDMAKNALSYAEVRISRMADVKKKGEK